MIFCLLHAEDCALSLFRGEIIFLQTKAISAFSSALWHADKSKVTSRDVQEVIISGERSVFIGLLSK